MEEDRFRSIEMQDVLKAGGGVTSDGLKQDIAGEKFYDFTAHFYRVGKPDVLRRRREVERITKVIFLKQHHGPESASALRDTFDQALLEKCGVELDTFMEYFTFVTDCAATMPCIVRASASSHRVRFTERWMGCISHQLNTVM